MAFKNIKGHSRIIILLQRSIIAERISHSYLFVGPESVGKKTAALNFSKVINCLKPRYYEKSIIDCCDLCENCKKIDGQIHPDIYLIAPAKNSIKIEQMKEIQAGSQFKPSLARWKIVIIEQAQTMTVEAANCILKILEEPPEYMLFIILATNVFLLPPTVVSRCQLFHFNLLSPELIVEILEDKFNIKPDKALLYSSIANGRADRAIELLQKKDLEKFRGDIIDLISGEKGEYIWKINLEKDKINICKLNVYKISEKMVLSFPSEKLSVFLDFIMLWYRDLFIFKTLKSRDKLINIDKLRIIKNEIEHLSLEELQERLDYISKFKENINKNVNTRLLLENFVSML